MFNIKRIKAVAKQYISSQNENKKLKSNFYIDIINKYNIIKHFLFEIPRRNLRNPIHASTSGFVR